MPNLSIPALYLGTLQHRVCRCLCGGWVREHKKIGFMALYTSGSLQPDSIVWFGEPCKRYGWRGSPDATIISARWPCVQVRKLSETLNAVVRVQIPCPHHKVDIENSFRT